ncbi:pseudouridine synthase family protein, partial [Staphylococcus epidermidis]
FTAFSSHKTQVQSKLTTLYHTQILPTKNPFHYLVTPSPFLYNILPLFLPFLIQLPKPNPQPNHLPNLLDHKNRNSVPLTAPPHPLYLE